jgi:type I restriction enzyme M protein
MASTKKDSGNGPYDPPTTLIAVARQKLSSLGYQDVRENFELFDPLGDGSMAATADVVAFDGNEPVVLFAAVAKGESSKPSVQDDARFKAGLGASAEKPFLFVWVSDSEIDYVLDLQKDAQIAAVPSVSEWRAAARPISESRRKLFQAVSAEYHRGDFRSIQKKFDALHEEIYSSGGVKPTNAAIDELGKLLFLKVHLEKSPRHELRTGAGAGKRFAAIFSGTYLREHKRQAVIELKDAFREINNLDKYKARDLTGEEHTVFAYDEPLRLEHPDVLASAIEALDLRDKEGKPIRLSVPDRDLMGNGERARITREHLIHEDLLGWAYDVFLRGKYASDEGLATYLTPSQVVECMSRLAFQDIPDIDLWARRGDPEHRERWNPSTEEERNLPAFLMGDICCGTGRFLVGGLGQVKRRLLDDQHVGHSDDEKLAWLSLMKRYSFFGADQAHGSITKARINMLMYGEGHSQLLKVDDAITDEHIDRLAGRFDLIMTNPPFGAGKYTDPKGLARMRRDDLGLELGWKWNGDRNKRKALDKSDPASLFLDRNLQLLKPGGRLLIIVPDGILCNSGDAYVREYLMGTRDEETQIFLGGKAIVKAVVSLPTETFSIAGTGAKTSFLFLQKKRHSTDKQGAVFMAVAEHVGYLKKGKTEVADPEGNDLVEIVTHYLAGTEIDQ